jgi:hypothetical protein
LLLLRPKLNDIVSLIEHLGYPSNKEGMCYGISGMGIQALLCNDIATFDQRIQVITEYIERSSVKVLADAIRSIEQKRVARIKEFKEQLLKAINQDIKLGDKDFYLLLQDKKHSDLVKKFNLQCSFVDQSLSDVEKQLIDIRAFVEGVVFNFRPCRYSEWFANPVTERTQSLELSFIKTLPDKLIKQSFATKQENACEEKGVYQEKDESLITRLKSWSGLYDKQELMTYFSLLRTHLPSTALQLISYEHAITVFYDSQINAWRLINNLPSKVYQDEEIAHAVLEAFFSKRLVLPLLQKFIVMKIKWKTWLMGCSI